MAYICPLCVGPHFSTVSLLHSHFRLLHFNNLNSPVNCGQNGCARSFTNFKMLRRHLTNDCNCIVSTLPIDAPMEEDGDIPSFKKPENGFIDYSIISEEAAIESIFDMYDEDSKSPSEFSTSANTDIDQSVLQNNALKFIGEFYSNPDLSRTTVNKIVDCTSTLFRENMSHAAKMVDLLKDEAVISHEVHSRLSEALSLISNPFRGLETEYKRFLSLQKRNCLLKPEPFVCGRGSMKSHTGQFISLKQTLKSFFELPGVLSAVRLYLESLEREDCLSNFVQGNLWKTKCQDFVGKFVLPLFFHFDEVETGNALGSHSSIHKLAAMNVKCPCLPKEFVSLIENHFLVLLFHASDRSADDPILETSNNKVIFSKVIAEMNELRTNGFSVNTECGVFQIYFDVGLILGDNLGLHSILGLVESFTANYPCLYCKISKKESESSCKQQCSLLRTVENYEEDLLIGDASATGIKEECVFHEIDSFHITTNYTVDFMHDILEGVANYDLVEILFNFVFIQKYFTIELLNSLISSHNFGNVSNRPPLISEKDLKEGSIRMSANEMLVFIQHLPVILGNLVPAGDEYWSLFLFLHEIVLILMSPKLQFETVSYLNYLIIQHHMLYVRLIGKLKPKHHHMLHYSKIILESGPPVHYWSMRFESKHRILKRYSNVCFSTVNLSLSVALKHQLIFAFRLLCKRGFTDRTTVSSRSVTFKITDLTRLYGVAPKLDVKCISSPNFVKIHGTCYKPGSCLLVSCNELGLPVFATVEKILVSKKNDVFFVMSEMVTLGYNLHLHSYNVTKSSTFHWFSFESLPWKLPVFCHAVSGDTSTVSLYHQI